MTEKVCFDKILPKDLMRPHRRTRGLDGNDRAISPIGKSWMNGTTLRVRFLGGTPRSSRRPRAGRLVGGRVQHRLRLRQPPCPPRTSGSRSTRTRRLVLRRHRQQEHPAERGHDEPRLPRRRDGGHEFGHAIALAHEHSNPAGRDPVERAGRHRRASEPPNFWDEATVRHNVFRKYALDQIKGAVRPGLDHALRVPGVVDAQRDRHTRTRCCPHSTRFVAGATMSEGGPLSTMRCSCRSTGRRSTPTSARAARTSSRSRSSPTASTS